MVRLKLRLLNRASGITGSTARRSTSTNATAATTVRTMSEMITARALVEGNDKNYARLKVLQTLGDRLAAALE